MTRNVFAIAAAAVVSVAAQDPAPRFEVTSVKPVDPKEPVPMVASGPTGFLPGGRYVARRMTGDRLLVLAFREEGSGTGLRPEQIVGVPAWMKSTSYNIDARVGGPPTAERIVDPLGARLLRSLVEDRFKLKYHFEKRELPFYALVVDKPGVLGPKLKVSALDCDAIQREREAARLEGRTPNIPPRPADPREPYCSLGLSRGRASGSGSSMVTIASMLTGAAGNNTVLDRTGLKGAFDLELTFAPEPQTPGAAPDLDAPSLFTAIREQLGLRLEQRREPRDVLVVDHVEPPNPD